MLLFLFKCFTCIFFLLDSFYCYFFKLFASFFYSIQSVDLIQCSFISGILFSSLKFPFLDLPFFFLSSCFFLCSWTNEVHLYLPFWFPCLLIWNITHFSLLFCRAAFIDFFFYIFLILCLPDSFYCMLEIEDFILGCWISLCFF